MNADAVDWQPMPIDRAEDADPPRVAEVPALPERGPLNSPSHSPNLSPPHRSFIAEFA